MVLCLGLVLHFKASVTDIWFTVLPLFYSHSKRWNLHILLFWHLCNVMLEFLISDEGASANIYSLQIQSYYFSFFQLQPSGGTSSSPSSPAAATPPAVGDAAQPSAAKPSASDAHPASELKPQPAAPSPSQPQPQPSPAPTEDPTQDPAAAPGAATASASAPLSDRQSPAVPQPARTPGSEDVRAEAAERPDGVAE